MGIHSLTTPTSIVNRRQKEKTSRRSLNDRSQRSNQTDVRAGSGRSFAQAEASGRSNDRHTTFKPLFNQFTAATEAKCDSLGTTVQRGPPDRTNLLWQRDSHFNHCQLAIELRDSNSSRHCGSIHKRTTKRTWRDSGPARDYTANASTNRAASARLPRAWMRKKLQKEESLNRSLTHTQWRAALRLHLVRLRKEVRPERRALAPPKGAHGGEAVSVPSLHAPFHAIRSFDQACAAPLARAAQVLASLAPGDGAVDGVGEAKQEARQQQCKQ